MKRRDFFKGLLGLACLPFISKVAEAKSTVILPPVTETLTFPNYPVTKTDKGIFMLDHWCNGYYEAVPLYPGDYLGPYSAKWVCRCEPIEVEIVKVRCGSHVLDEKWTCKTFIRGL